MICPFPTKGRRFQELLDDAELALVEFEVDDLPRLRFFPRQVSFYHPLTLKIHVFGDRKGLLMVQSRCLRGFDTNRRPFRERAYHNTAFLFPEIFDRPVIAQFDQPQSSSDGGAILLKAANRRLGLTEALAACLQDERQTGKERARSRRVAEAAGHGDRLRL